MTRLTRRLIVLAIALTLPALTGAQSTGGNYSLRKSVVSGGIVAQGGRYRLTATASLPAAVQTGGAYRLTAGFHAPSAPSADRVFCNGFESTNCP